MDLIACAALAGCARNSGAHGMGAQRYYPTKGRFHYSSLYLPAGHRDVLATWSRRPHTRGIRVVGR